MSPSPDVVERRLAHQRDSLAELRKLMPLSVARLSAEPVTRAAVERMIQAVVDLALDINGHIAASELGRAPSTGRESFDLMVKAGVLDQRQADALKPAVGLRNVLVRLYADIDVALIVNSTAAFEAGFSDYVRTVARWLLNHGPACANA